MNKKLKVALLFGGKSVEHTISVRSATNIAQNIDRSKFDVVLIGIDQNGKWHLNEDTSGDIKKGPGLALILDTQCNRLLNVDTNESLGQIDMVFPVLHGTDGEDGSVQGLLKAACIPFVGTGVLGSAISMDKLVSKRLLKEAGIPVSRYLSYSFEERASLDYSYISTYLGGDFMAKAGGLGSSVGISKVTGPANFKAAVKDAFNYDERIIFEEFISGRELECAVMGNAQAQASYPGEIIIKGNYDFYTYDAKYTDKDAVALIVPAEISDGVAESIKALSIKAYKALQCEDFARVDLFLKQDGSIIINEINTIPGFTSASMFPMLWENEGINYSNLITKLITLACERFEETKRLKRDFQSQLL